MGELVASNRLSSIQPGVTDALDRLNQAAWAAVDTELLELCEALVVENLGARKRPRGFASAERLAAVPSFRTSPLLSEFEKACLAFTEQWTFSVDSMTDADVEPLLGHWGPSQTWTFVTALYAVEMTVRADLVTEALFVSNQVGA